MKTSYLAVALAALALTGCDDDNPSQDEENQFVQSEALKESNAQQAADQKDLEQTIKELQQQDPTVKDAYYGVDKDGNKQLHIVKEEANSGGYSETVWPLVGGLATGYLLAKMFSSNGGYSHYNGSYRPSNSYSYMEDDRRKHRNTVTSGYTGAIMNSSRASALSKQKAKISLSKPSTQAVQSRKSGAFARSSGGGGRSSGS